MAKFASVVLLFVCIAPAVPGAEPASAAAPVRCSPAGTPHTRTTLYFGLARPAGTVSETQWKAFIRDEVTPRFPNGLTVWEANGQWRGADGRIVRESAKVLLLIHDDTDAVRAALTAVITRYKIKFQQESVLWESAPVCVAF